MFYIRIPYLDLDSCFSTEQALNWYRVKDGKYYISNGEKFVVVEQGYKDMFSFSCNEQTFYDVWYKYFMVDKDYLKLNYKVKFIDSDFKRMSVRGAGLRLLREQFNEVLVREIFREKFNTYLHLSCYVNWFKMGCGKRHAVQPGGNGKYVWYEMPNSTKEILDKYKRIVSIFKSEVKGKYKKDVIWCLKKIKEIFTDIDNKWHNFEEMQNKKYESWEVVDVLAGYDLDVDTCKRIAIYGTYKHDQFILDDKIKCCIENNLDYEYSDIEDFMAWNLSDVFISNNAAYLNMQMRYEMDVPPKKGDEVLWE